MTTGHEPISEVASLREELNQLRAEVTQLGLRIQALDCEGELRWARAETAREERKLNALLVVVRLASVVIWVIAVVAIVIP